ncbi:hypothetical protein ACSTS3_19725 [Aquimarina muelleri]|uniref:hypothetical protein n=1 Tax=Aquimarina muelleri TaxID=279356 RepID=UPI003F683A9F
MKKPLHIIKSWFETGDIPTELQFNDSWDSFHHKDNGEVIVEKTVNENGDVSFTFSDGESLTIEKFIPDVSKPMEYIDGLVDSLRRIRRNINNIRRNKVDKEDGKGLSDTNFTQAEKDKLEGLENYNPPTSQPISFIEGLQEVIDELTQNISLKVDKEDGKGLSDTNFTQEEKDKLANINSELTIYNLSDYPAFLNYTYFGKKVYGVLLEVPNIQDGNYIVEHNLNVLTYLRIEIRENGLPLNNTGQIAREDLTKLVYYDNAGTITLTKDTIAASGYLIPENKLMYVEYIGLTEGVGADTVGTTPIGA